MFIFMTLLILLFCVTFLMYGKQEKLTNNTVLCFTGGLGCGKTFMAVQNAIKFFKRFRLKWFIAQITFIKRKKFPRATIYSNIPIRIKAKGCFLFFFKTKEQWSRVLTKEHLLLIDKIPENAVILIDEIGQIASQYDFDNPFVMEQLQEFIRFYRHYVNGRLILTDQSSSNIIVPLRRRINKIYCLDNFKRWLWLMPFYKVTVSVLEVIEESVTNQNLLQTSEKGLIFQKKQLRPYFFGFLPYKWQKKKKLYDSRCYSINYKPACLNPHIEYWDKYKTDYLIDISASGEQRKQYYKDRKRIYLKAAQPDKDSETVKASQPANVK